MPARKSIRKTKVFGIGYHRTGTTTLHRCLSIFGYKAKHLFVEKVFPSIEVLRKTTIKDLNLSVVDQYDALTDMPAPYPFRELDMLYPGGKFILTVRETGAWLGSVEWLFKHSRPWWEKGRWQHAWHERLYGVQCSGYDERRIKATYLRHSDEVLEYFQDRSDDLLVVD